MAVVLQFYYYDNASYYRLIECCIHMDGSAFIHAVESVFLPDDDLAMLVGRFELGHFSDELFRQLSISAPEPVKTAVAKRQAEFLAGRFLARTLLEQRGIQSQDVAIGPNRAPIWPHGIVGSISHHDQLAACVISHQTHERCGVGLDIERLIAPELVAGMAGVVTDPEEGRRLSTQGMDNCVLMTLIFSAKESIFKALYPQVQRYFDFLEVACTHLDEQWLHFELKCELAATLPSGRKGKVYYQMMGESVLTFTRSEYFD